VKYALVELNLHPWQVCLCYDVGCHGNGSDKIEGYRFHGLQLAMPLTLTRRWAVRA
jgi:2-oxoglutarate/2-oxoacid ferredoxin oxidoreductase subunit beta